MCVLFRLKHWLWLLGVTLCLWLAPGEDEVARDTSDCVIYDKFLQCAEAYVRGEDMGDRQLTSSIRLVLTVPQSELCQLARAVAGALSAEMSFWLSRPLAEEIPQGPERIAYEAEVAIYVQDLLRSALKDYSAEQSSVAVLPYVRIFGQILERVGQILQLQDVFRAPALLAGLSDDERRQRFLATAQDRLWKEAWFPALLQAARPWWEVSNRVGISQEQQEEVNRLSVEERARLQEQTLQKCFFEVLDHLEILKDRGVVKSFFPRGSTLLALLRYGRLFGRFEDGQLDCVGDDVDIEIVLPDSGSGTWPRFVRALSQVLQMGGQQSYECFVGGPVQELAKLGARYDTLLCVSSAGAFECPVSFVRSKASTDAAQAGVCLAYGRNLSCPTDTVKRLAKYGGCTALPNITLASLTVGNDCVEWMQHGLSLERVAEMRVMAQELEDRGYQSMAALWRDASCKKIPFKDGAVYVGEEAGQRLVDFYGKPEVSRADTESCIPVVRDLTDAVRCRERMALVQHAMVLLQKGGEAAGYAMILDGPTACCPPGKSLVEVNAEPDLGMVLCFAPGKGNMSEEGHAGLYDLEEMETSCPENPTILVLDPLPSAAGAAAMRLFLRVCLPSHYLITSAITVAGTLSYGVPILSAPDSSMEGGTWTIWEGA